MIIDKLSNKKCYYGLGERIKKAFEYLDSIDPQSIEKGKYLIDGENIYASVQEYDTKLPEDGRWEAHKRYIDIQYIVKGEEKMGYTNVNNIKTTVEYDASKDIFFGEGKGDLFLVKEGNFAIFYPEDAHMPCICNEKPESLKKIVLKILLAD